MPANDKFKKINKRRIGSENTNPNLGYYIIVTDTEETEKNYMLGIKNSIPEKLKRKLIIVVKKGKTCNLVNEAISQKANQPQYCEPWIVFDRDQVKNFDKIISEARENNINVGWSNPCIEIWFTAYFGSMPTYQTSVECCKGFEDIFLKNTRQKYQKSDDRIYDKLCKFGDEAKAIEIADTKLKQYKIDNKNKPSEMCPATTLHLLVREIKNKTKNNE